LKFIHGRWKVRAAGVGTCGISELDRASHSKNMEAGENAQVRNEVHVVTNLICATVSDEKDWPEMFLGR
jgi:hypothetical protein